MLCSPNFAQAPDVYARSFYKSKADVEQALRDLQVSAGEKLPILDGFVAQTEQPLEQYERGFCKYSVELVPSDAGRTVVTVKAKITAWYADRDVAKSGYQVLPSNGRLELDFLDRLEEKLTGKPVSSATIAREGMQAPRPKLDLSGVQGMSGATAPHNSTPPPDEVASMRAERIARERHVEQLTAQLQNLQEIKKNQAKPQNLVVVQKSQTPIYAKNVSASKVLFEAAQNDEFEFLDGNDDWIHIAISGDSRGYVQRSAVELSDFLVAKLDSPTGNDPLEKFTAFRIEREEVGIFPGSWASLRGKSVKIYTVLPVSTNLKESGPAARLSYALLLFERGAKEAPATSPVPEGVVVIFDSADGGIAAATLPDISKLSAKTIPRDAFWAGSYLDPDDAFHAPAK
jgi:hypothetical protein